MGEGHKNYFVSDQRETLKAGNDIFWYSEDLTLLVCLYFVHNYMLLIQNLGSKYCPGYVALQEHKA